MGQLDWKLGAARITRFVEMETAVPAQGLFPEASAEALAAHRRWLDPGFVAPDGSLTLSIHALLVEIGGARILIDVFVATLGHSRRCHVRAFRHEQQASWFSGLESAFTTFGGVPEQVLMDNPRALVVRHDAVSRTVQFNDKLLAFARHWGFAPRACAPYRARTKGKTESGVGYVKKNAIAGHSFPSWEAFEAHLARWEREVANVRVHGTTGEAPIVRFEREEVHRLKPLGGRPSFGSLRELTRTVSSDCAVEVDTNSYSVPWRLIGETVEVIVAGGLLRVRHGSHEVAVHAIVKGRRQRVIDARHLEGVAGVGGQPVRAQPEPLPQRPPQVPPALLRPLAEYEAIAGGAF